LLYAHTYQSIHTCISGSWSRYTDTSESIVMEQIIWSLSNLGFESATFRSLAQHANQLL
jgi:hypothetical protein